MREFVRRTPALHAAWLEWTGPRRRARVVALAAGTVGATLAVAFDVAGTRDLVAAVGDHPLLLAAFAAMLAVMTGSARRARREAGRAHAWAGALPVAVGDTTRANWLSTGAPAWLVGTIASALLLAARSSALAFLALWIALVAGVTAAALWRPAPLRPPPPGSRYVPATTPREWRRPPTLAPLAAWPFREAFVRAQPRAASRAALPVLLLLPAGISALAAVALLALATVAFAAVALGAGTFAAWRGAPRWLAPTPAARRAVRGASTRSALLVIGAVAFAGGALVAVLTR